MTRLDTHVAVWLAAGDVDRLSPTARGLLEVDPIVVSPIVELEVTYLHEIGRLGFDGVSLLDLLAPLGARRSDAPFDHVVGVAHGLTWTRDPFDRLLVADAIASADVLVTRDQRLLDAAPDVARW